MKWPWQRRDAAQSNSDFFQRLAGNGVVIMGGDSDAGITVNTDTALQVPAVAAAVNFQAASLAGLPLQVYKRTREGRERVTGPIAKLLHDCPNPYLTSFEWRKSLFAAKFTGGRGFAYIEKNNGRPVAIWPLDPEKMTVKRDGFVNSYEYTDGRKIVYEAHEIIDLPFMLKSDGFSHRGPISMGKDAIGLALAVTKYGSKFLANGGVPPYAVTGNFGTPQAMARASDDLAQATRKATKENRQALVLPTGMEIKQIGANPEQSQMIETQRFCIEQIARLYSIPPTFLQDLTHGTFSNTEQQDLHFVKHTLKQHVEQFEQELNLKLFGGSRSNYVELNMDGLLRGDFKTRMEGNARAIQTGQLMPNEARARENLPPMPGGNSLYIQGATVPIEETGEEE